MIRLSVPSLPPSSNNAYFNRPGGGRSLTKIGEGYKNITKAHLQQNYRRELMEFRPNRPYLIAVTFYFLDLQNKTWPKTAESRYKRLDTSNRIKLLEDVLKDVSGVDDSNTLTLILTKTIGSPERTELAVWDLEKEESPFDVLLNTLF